MIQNLPLHQTATELFLELRNFCEDHADENMVKKYSRYFKGPYNAWGITQQLMDVKKAELKKRSDITFEVVFEVAPMLMESGKYEETSFALILFSMLSNTASKAEFKQLEKWFETGISNWAHADYLGMFLLPELIKKNIIHRNDLIPWIESPYKFQRRCVPVTYIKQLKETSPTELFGIIKPLMADPEREVHQGVGWFLREAWKVHQAVTEEFLLSYKDTSPRLIFQYACEKMTPENKQRFKKSK